MVEPLSIAFHAVERTPIAIDDTVVVIGVGIIGLLVVQTLRKSGCGKIIAVDINQERLDLACSLGADYGFNSDQCNVREEILSQSHNRGADVVFEAVGIASTLQTSLSILKKGGALTLIGNLSPVVEVPLQLIVTHEVALYGSCASCGEYPECLDMINGGTVNIDALISATAPLSEGASWFRRLYNREPGLMKVILIP